jgi:rhamnosyl/mannosyltransferase
MRVLQLGKYYYPYRGGIESHLRLLAERLGRSQTVEVVVYNRDRRTVHERVGGVSVTRVATLGRVASTEICPRLIGELSRHTYDVLHLHAPNPMAMLAYALARKPRQHALVITHHSDVIRQRGLRMALGPIFSAVMRRADAIIVNSQRYLETSPELAPYRSKSSVIPLGIEEQAASGDPSPRLVEFASRHRGRVVLAVGRMVPYKGFRILLRALASIDAGLILVGSGPLEQELRREASALGITERVAFLGDVEPIELRGAYGLAQVFALPSVERSEAFGVVQLEAMAAGVPIVNTDLASGVPEVSPHGVTGLTVQPGDPAAFGAALARILDAPELGARLGEAGRNRVRAQFTAERMVEQISTLYGSVIRGESSVPRAA